MSKFKEFIDSKEKAAIKHLNIIKKVLDSKGLQTKSFLNKSNPYIFVHSTDKDLSFGGIRIYAKNDIICYRIQKEEQTEPYGMAYPIPVEDMFEDLLIDYPKPEEAGKKLVEDIASEIKRFFIESALAEKQTSKLDDLDPMSRIVVRTQGTDYANLIQSKT